MNSKIFLVSLLVFTSCITRKTITHSQALLTDADLETIPDGFKLKNFKVLVISLDEEKSKLRYQRMQTKLAEYPNLTITLLRAVDGRKWLGKYDGQGKSLQVLDKENGYD